MDHSDDQHHNQHLNQEEVGHFPHQTKGFKQLSNKPMTPRVPLG